MTDAKQAAADIRAFLVEHASARLVERDMRFIEKYIETLLVEREAQYAVMRQALGVSEVSAALFREWAKLQDIEDRRGDRGGSSNDREIEELYDQLEAAKRRALASDAGKAMLNVVDVAAQMRELLDWAEKNNDGVMGGSAEHQKLRDALAAIGR